MAKSVSARLPGGACRGILGGMDHTDGSTARTMPLGPDEVALVAGLRAGEPDAYERLVRQHGGHLLAVARRLTGNEEDARDAVQDAFLSAYKAMDRFDGTAKLSTWLHRIAVNAALMKLRTRRRKPEQPIEPLLPAFLDDGHQANPAAPWRDAGAAVLENL